MFASEQHPLQALTFLTLYLHRSVHTDSRQTACACYSQNCFHLIWKIKIIIISAILVLFDFLIFTIEMIVIMVLYYYFSVWLRWIYIILLYEYLLILEINVWSKNRLVAFELRRRSSNTYVYYLTFFFFFSFRWHKNPLSFALRRGRRANTVRMTSLLVRIVISIFTVIVIDLIFDFSLNIILFFSNRFDII